MNEPDLSKLSAYFSADDLEWKPITFTKDKAKALAAAYVDNRAIMDRLDEVCGPGNWRNEFRPGPDGGVLCGISVRVGGEWVTKYDGAENTDIEPIKGGLSGSMRRAAVQWGIGRYLYKLPSVWVTVDDRGRFTEAPRVPPAFLPGAESRRAPAPPPVDYEEQIGVLLAEVADAEDAPDAFEARKVLKKVRSRWEPLIADWPADWREAAVKAWQAGQERVKAAFENEAPVAVEG